MTPFAAALTSALAHSLWQDAVIAGILVALFAVLRTPQARYAAGCAALTAMLAVPVVTGFARAPTAARPWPISAASAPLATSPASRSAAVPPGGGGPQPSLVSGAQAWALPLWCAGVIAFSLRLLGSGAHTFAIRRRSVAADDALRTLATGIAARMGVGRRFAVLVSAAGNGPATIGWLRPAIVVPAVMSGLPADQFTAILAHELAHIRRHDFLVNLFQLVVETLYFYHPAVWWVSRRIRLERELCCDDDVVATCGDAVGYARALTFIARHAVTVASPALSAAGSPLLYRVGRLLGARDQHHEPSSWTLALAAILIVAGALANPRWLQAQEAGSATGTLISGTLYDPFGQPGNHVMLVLVGGPEVSRDTRTDETGRFQFSGVTPGRYYLRTPATDYLAPNEITVTAGRMSPLIVKLESDETAVNIRVCRDCRDSWFRLPPLVTGVPGDQQSETIIARAEPEEGWDAFNQRPLSYPADLKASTVEGTVAVEGIIRPDGTTADLQVVSSPSPQLSAAALGLLQPQRWHPARVRATTVPVPLHATVEFTLNGD